MARLVTVVIVVAVVVPAVLSVSLFSALRRGFEEQEEATYTVLYSGQGYEARQYPGRRWVCTRQGARDSDQLSVFIRLFAYIDGENTRSERLVMGVPVSVEARGGEGGQRTLQGCFFIPEVSQEDPPAPSDPRLFIVDRSPMVVFSRRFGGFANDEDTWDGEVAQLRQDLQQAKEDVDPALAFWNAYDSPITLFGRRNEVWLVQATDAAPPTL